jgi:hypothetical protein
MNTQQGSPAAEGPVVDLHHLAFIKTQDDGRMAVFQATIEDIKKTDEAVLELTVTMASSAGDEKASQEIQKFLSEVRAGFAVTALNPDDGKDAVTAPNPEDGKGESQDLDEFDIDDGILFEAELIRRGPDKAPVGVTMVVQNAVDGYTWAERILIALADVVLWVAAWILRLLGQPYKINTLPGSVAYKECHQYTAKPAKPMQATVTSSDECADVSGDRGQWERTICKNARPWVETTKVVTVTGATKKKKCTYTLQGDFQLTYSS